MQSYLLQPKDIQKITGPTYYERGKRYFESGKVYGLSHNSAIRSWRAVVAGTHDYEVRVFFLMMKMSRRRANARHMQSTIRVNISPPF